MRAARFRIAQKRTNLRAGRRKFRRFPGMRLRRDDPPPTARRLRKELAPCGSLAPIGSAIGPPPSREGVGWPSRNAEKVQVREAPAVAVSVSDKMAPRAGRIAIYLSTLRHLFAASAGPLAVPHTAGPRQCVSIPNSRQELARWLTCMAQGRTGGGGGSMGPFPRRTTLRPRPQIGERPTSLYFRGHGDGWPTVLRRPHNVQMGAGDQISIGRRNFGRDVQESGSGSMWGRFPTLSSIQRARLRSSRSTGSSPRPPRPPRRQKFAAAGCGQLPRGMPDGRRGVRSWLTRLIPSKAAFRGWMARC